MRFIYYYTGAVNGEDALGHYIRSSFEVVRVLGALELGRDGCGSTFATTVLSDLASAAGAPAQSQSQSQAPAATATATRAARPAGRRGARIASGAASTGAASSAAADAAVAAAASARAKDQSSGETVKALLGYLLVDEKPLQRVTVPQPDPDRRDHDADHGDRGLPRLQRQQRAAVRPDLQPQRRGPRRRRADRL